MSHHILLAVTGMSPQVVTETLYAIHREGRTWPDEIRLITTRAGRDAALKGLIEDGHLDQLCLDYGQPRPLFSQQQILMVPNAKGEPVDDARSLSDHEALADFITGTVCDLTASDGEVGETTLHASLAGGRKTMTFYLGYAMSLFGRQSDCLSHVLITEAFEGLPEFYYPTPEPRTVHNRDGDALDASQADVVLADIPLIRHRDYLPGQFHHLHSGVRFRALVDLINLAQQPDQVRVVLDDANAQLVVGTVDSPNMARVELALIDYAFYRMLVCNEQEDGDLIMMPPKTQPDTDLAHLFLEHLVPLMGIAHNPNLALTQLLDELTDAAHLNPGRVMGSTIDSLRAGMKSTFLSSRVGDIGTAMGEKLPQTLRELLEPRQLIIRYVEENEEGDEEEPEVIVRKSTLSELRRRGVEKEKGGGYAMLLSPEQFRILGEGESLHD